MLIQRLSLGLFIIPLVTVFVCLSVVIAFNIYEPCNPFINGCYTISRIGRSHPGVLIFKPIMLITAILIIAYCFEHIRIFKKFLISKIYLNLILLFGLVSTICLFIYILFLGVEGSEIWKFMRRGGIFIYIISLVFAQFFIALSYKKLKNDYNLDLDYSVDYNESDPNKISYMIANQIDQCIKVLNSPAPDNSEKLLKQIHEAEEKGDTKRQDSLKKRLAALDQGSAKEKELLAQRRLSTAELEKQKAKQAGTAKQAEVAKPAVVAVQQEETHTQVEVIDLDPINGVQTATIDLEERSLSEPEMNKREEIVKSMKKNMAGFKERYGERAKSVMYATATKQAKKD